MVFPFIGAKFPSHKNFRIWCKNISLLILSVPLRNLLFQEVPFPPAQTFQVEYSSFWSHLSIDTSPLRMTTGLSLGGFWQPEPHTLVSVFRYQRVIFKNGFLVLFWMVPNISMCTHTHTHTPQQTADTRNRVWITSP